MKRIFPSVFEFIKQSQIILGAGGALLASETYRLLYQEKLPLTITAFLFFAVLSAYTFLGIKISSHNQRLSIEIKKAAYNKIIIAWFSIGITLFLFFIQEKKVQSVAALLLIFTLAYMTPFYLNQKKVKGLRDVFILKSTWLAFVWSVATVLIPAVHYKGFDFGKEELFFFIQRFLFILAIALVFNIRDYNYDGARNMRTIVTISGVKKTKFIAVLFLLLSFLMVNLMAFEVFKIAFMLSISYTIILTIISRPSNKNFFYVVLMDGSLLVQASLLILCRLT